MKKLISSVLALFFILFIPSAQKIKAAEIDFCEIATGAANTAVNGIYTNTGLTNNGRPVYTMGGNWYIANYHSGSDNYWTFSSDLVVPSFDYAVNSYADRPDGLPFFGGASPGPGPDVIYGECSGAPASGDQFQQNIFNSFILFFIMSFGIIAYYRSRFRR